MNITNVLRLFLKEKRNLFKKVTFEPLMNFKQNKVGNIIY